MHLPLRSLAISGYRSYGKLPQYFPRLGKVNVIIGPNNVGKSNILRFLLDVYPKETRSGALSLDPLDRHLDGGSGTYAGTALQVDYDEQGAPLAPKSHHVLQMEHVAQHKDRLRRVIGKVLHEKARLDGTAEAWSLCSYARR